MGFREGGEAGAEAAKKNQGVRSLVRYLTSEATLKDEGDRCFVRPITEQTKWIYVDMHQFMPTKEKPKDHEGNWPEKMSAVCQNDVAFMNDATGEYLPGYGNCYICTAPQYKALDRFKKPLCKKTLRGWALMCLREPVVEGDEIVGFQDAVVEARTGKDTVEEVRNIVVAVMGQKNFFANLSTQFHTFKTIRSADFLVQVTGEGTDKNFTFIRMDPIPDHKPGTDSWKLYEDACEKQGLDLKKIITDQASPEHYQKFFIPGAGETAASTKPEATAGPAKPDGAKMDDIMARITSHAAKKPDVNAA